MKRFIIVFGIVMLALISMPVMANEMAVNTPTAMATITADMAIPVSMSVDAAPLVKAIEAQTRSVSIGLLALVSTMIGISLAFYSIRKPVSLTVERFATKNKKRKPRGDKQGPVPTAPEELKKSGGVRKPRKPRAMNTAAGA